MNLLPKVGGITSQKTITLLRPVNAVRASKSYKLLPDGTIKKDGYPNAAQFSYESEQFTTFAEFVEILERRAAASNCFAIHGERVDWIAPGRVNRRVHAWHDDGKPACFRENPNGTSWLMIDVDDYPNQWGKPSDALEMRAITYGIVCDLLPIEFQQAAYWYQWSNGMGVGDPEWSTLKVHLWFMLSAPLTDTVLGQWAKTTDAIDESVCRTVQPNYLATPHFVDMPDPITFGRSGAVTDWCTREDVELVYEFLEPAEMRKRSDALVRFTQALWAEEGKKFRVIDPDNASAPMRKIADIGVGSRCHAAIIASAASWVTSCGRNPDAEEWKRLVRERVAVSGNPQASERSSERYLNDVFRSAERKYRSINPDLPSVPRELINNTNQF